MVLASPVKRFFDTHTHPTPPTHPNPPHPTTLPPTPPPPQDQGVTTYRLRIAILELPKDSSLCHIILNLVI